MTVFEPLLVKLLDYLWWFFKRFILYIPMRLRRLLQREKRIVDEDVGASLQQLKRLFEEQLAKETSAEKRQALKEKLEQVVAAERGYYMAMLKSALERSDIPAYDELVAIGERRPGIENRAKLYKVLSKLQHLPPPHTSGNFMASAIARHALGRYDEALADFNRALELEPDDPEVFNNRGVTYDHLERYEEALSDYGRALKLKPDYPATLFNRGATYSSLGRYEAALADYTRALELRPDFLEALDNRGVTYMELGCYDEAIADFNRSLQLEHDAPHALYNMACLFSIQRKPDDAIPYLEKAIALDGKYREQAATDSDFESIRYDTRFRRLIEGD